jgi:hypothetical protein
MLRLASIRPKAVKFPIRAEVILNSTVIPVALSNAFITDKTEVPAHAPILNNSTLLSLPCFFRHPIATTCP